MTARQIYEGVLIELNKVKARSLLLEEFNYLFNKAVLQYINKRYNIYDTNQQTTDDLRVLTSSVALTPKLADENSNSLYTIGTSPINLYQSTYQVELPTDYFHTLNCICAYKVNTLFKCYNPGNIAYFPAKRLTADLWGSIINNYYERPLYCRPYYYIHNINTSSTTPTNPATGNILGDPADGKNNTGTDGGGVFNLPRYIYTTAGPSVVYSVYKRAVNNQSSVQCLGINMTADQIIALDIKDLYTTTSEGVKTVKVQDWTTGTADTVNQYRVDYGTSNVERQGTVRYGNTSTVRMEIRYGKDNSVFELAKVIIDYIKVPQTIRFTQDQLDSTIDTSQMLEFPDYVCQEIINELVTIVMENTADPRLQTHIPISQSIANPAQQSEQIHKK